MEDWHIKYGLSRDYRTQPLGRQEPPAKEDLVILQTQLLTTAEIATYFKKSKEAVGAWRRKLNVRVSKEHAYKIQKKSIDASPEMIAEAKRKRDIYWSNPENRKKMSDIKNTLYEEHPEKKQQTSDSLKTYYEEHPERSEKIRREKKQWWDKASEETKRERSRKKYETEQKNNTLGVGKETLQIGASTYKCSVGEKAFYTRLAKHYPNTVFQKRIKGYGVCDFYIPELDLYIEYQGLWTHGVKPYQPDDPECIEQLENWKAKPQTRINSKGNTRLSYYAIAIKVWTEYDVRRREWMRRRGYNYVEYFPQTDHPVSYSPVNVERFLNIGKTNTTVDFSALEQLCLNTPFPGTEKWPANHPIWQCYIGGSVSPFEAWFNPEYIKKAITNLKWVWEKGLREDKWGDYLARWKRAIDKGGIDAARVVLNRFTVAKIAPKVTALKEGVFKKIIEESGKDISRGIYCPMAGFGGIVRAAQDLGVEVEAYDINPRLNDWYGWEYRNALAQVVETNKIVAACPPFGLGTSERWPGTPEEMYYSFEEWCTLLRKHIIAPDYIFIGPERKNKNACGLFGKTRGVQYYPDLR
jgi:hypothetical protein